MRFVRLIPAVTALFISAAASAQVWDGYVNRENFFTVNLPSDPTETQVPYKTAKGTSLTAHTFAADAPANTVLAGRYSVTVVDYSSAKDELPTAIEEAAKTMRAKGAVKYEGVNMLDNHRSWRMTVETPDKHRILAEILVAANNRLYLTQAETALNTPPPANFQASLQILDANGVRIRNRQVEPATADEIVPVTPQQRALDVTKYTALVQGSFKNVAGGTCEAAFYKSGESTKTKRGENSVVGTITNGPTVVKGQLIIQGPRIGQFVNPETDKVIMLFDSKPNDRLVWSAMDAPTIGWPDTTVELCPGSRG